MTGSGPAAAEDIAAALEAGRRLFARPWRFSASAPAMAALPPPAGIEVAFAGRSNVGKSSLINALTGQKALARTSNTPGRTKELNFFVADAPVAVVDMPGYGYARVSKAEVAAWTKLVFDYLRGRANLRRVYLLVDARHGLKAPDETVLKTLDTAAVSYQVVLTKADQVKPAALAACLEATAAALARRSAAYPGIVATSARTGAGMPELRAAVARLLAERS